MADGLIMSVTASPDLRDVQGRFASMSDPLAVLRAAGLMRDAGQIALEVAKEYAPVASGQFQSGLTVEEFGDIGFAIVTNDANLLEWLRTGTGVYAGGGRITALNARAMVFSSDRWRKAPIPPNYGGRYAFTSIAGMAANPWQEEAYAAIMERITPILNQAARAFQAQLGLGYVE